MKNTEISYYIGEVTEIVETDEFSKEYHIIKADIPGVVSGVRAFPKQGELDEPVIGDQVLLVCLDPLFQSYFIYSKLKESDFIGVRASGKMIDITPEALSVSVYRPEENNLDTERPEPTISEVRLDKDGNIDVDLNTESGTVNINGGYNGGLINISALIDFMWKVQKSMSLNDRGASLLTAIPEILEKLEDKRFKH